MKNNEFPADFLWGTATSSYQIEGAWNIDGKGKSIWDEFCEKPGAVFDKKDGKVACNHYYTYKNDIKIMKELGIKTYRLSISWPRIFPEGTGKVNKKGIEFYRNLILEIIANDIIPAVTIYHWDLPQELQKKGGWTNRDISDHFKKYAKCLFENFGDIVPLWITLNEPFIVANSGHYWGNHAPGLRDAKSALLVSHNLLLAHGKAVAEFKKMNLKGEIGITLNMLDIVTETDSDGDLRAAKIYDEFQNRWYIEPIIFGKYPEFTANILKEKKLFPEFPDEDLDIIKQKIDFVGLNYYTGELIKKSEYPDLILEHVKIKRGLPLTEMDWEIYPQGLYNFLKRISSEYLNKIYITECGAAFDDKIDEDGKVNDENRIDFFKKHFIQIKKAIDDGINVKGFFAWSLLDNFEWDCGYTKRFGLVYVDYENNQKRMLKKSALWYKEFIKKNSL